MFAPTSSTGIPCPAPFKASLLQPLHNQIMDKLKQAGRRHTQHETETCERVSLTAVIQPFGDYSPTELGRPPTAMGAALVRGSPRPSNIVRECSAECSPAVQLPVGARVANEALSHKEGKEQQPCMAVVGQFIDNERDAGHSPDIVAVPTQLNACLHHAESEGGHKFLLTPGECVVVEITLD